MASPSGNNDHYYRTLEVFLKLSNERQANLACLRKHLPDAMRKLQLGVDQPSFKILSIGAGEGFMDYELVKIVKDKYLNEENHLEQVQIWNTAIEPNQEYEAQYNEYFQTRLNEEESSRRDSVGFEFRPETFESYMKSDHHPNQYDMIQAIHSIYYVRPYESTLEYSYHHELGDKGLIVCILAGKNCMYNILREPLNEYRSDENKKKRLQAVEKIRSLADEQGWVFSQFPCPIAIDVTGIVKKPVSDDGKLLLDFLTRSEKFFEDGDKESVSPLAARNAVMDKLEEISKEDGDGRMIVKEDNVLIIIEKKPREK